MALGSITTNNNNHNHHHPYLRQPLQQNVFNTKSKQIYQQQQQQHCKPRAIAPASTALTLHAAAARKASSEKFYGGAMGTTLDSNNPAVVRRNARERNRVKQVNNGFTHLRQHIPPAIVADLSNGRRGIGPGAHKKLSKVDTLRMAVEYIRRLKHVIDEVDGKRGSAKAPATTWTTTATHSPPPTPPKAGLTTTHSSMFADKIQQHFQTQNYTDILQQQQQQHQQTIHFKYEQNHLQQLQYFNQHPALISPAGSISSNQSSSDFNDSDSQSLYSHSPNALVHQQFTLPLQMKYEQQHYNEEEMPANSSGDEEDLLEYISLWQDDV